MIRVRIEAIKGRGEAKGKGSKNGGREHLEKKWVTEREREKERERVRVTP